MELIPVRLALALMLCGVIGCNEFKFYGCVSEYPTTLSKLPRSNMTQESCQALCMEQSTESLLFGLNVSEYEWK